jgi:hypothetical protein
MYSNFTIPFQKSGNKGILKKYGIIILILRVRLLL